MAFIRAILGLLLFGFLAVTSTRLALAPGEVFTRPEIVKYVGTADLRLARGVCIVVAIISWLFAMMCLVYLTFPDLLVSSAN